MGASYPKPESQRRNRMPHVVDWIDLPVENESGAPPLPKWRKWHPETKLWWIELWKKPQAKMWDQTGSTLWVMASLIDDMITGVAETKGVSNELRQHEDRHGLNPKALLQLRWRLPQEVAEQSTGEPQPVEEAPNSVPQETQSRRERLRIVG